MMKKMKQIRAKHKVYNKLQVLGMMQIPIPMINFSLLNTISRDHYHPLFDAMSTQGFFWF